MMMEKNGEGILVKEIQPPVAASTNAGAHVLQNLADLNPVESWARRTREFDFDQESWGSFNDVDSQFEPPVMDDPLDGIEFEPPVMQHRGCTSALLQDSEEQHIWYTGPSENVLVKGFALYRPRVILRR
jgi:hypothetical protein